MTTAFTNGIISSAKNKGKQILQNVLKTKTQKVSVKVAKPQTSAQKCRVGYQKDQTSSRLHQIWRGLVPRHYYNSLAANLGRQAAWRAGRNAPLMAFFGLVVSRNRDQSEDVITARVQDFIKTASPCDHPFWDGLQRLSLDNFEFGSLIGQGCNAAVYEAKLGDKVDEDKPVHVSHVLNDNEDVIEAEHMIVTDINKGTLDETAEQDEGCDGIYNDTMLEDLDDPQRNSKNEDSESFHGNVSNTNLDIHHDDSMFEDSYSNTDSDTDSDITVISWESDEEYLREEGAPLMFTVDNEAQLKYEEADTTDDEFEIIQETGEIEEETEVNMSVLQESLIGIAEILRNHQRNQESLDELESLTNHSNTESSPVLKVETQSSMNLGDCGESVDNGNNNCDGMEEYRSLNSSIFEDDGRTRPKLKYDLAVKMMFNYDIESNATAILRSMEKETLPSRMSTLFLPRGSNGEINNLNRVSNGRKKTLPAHPNIVEMWGVFVDPVPRLPDGLMHYPAALPSRINPDGMGRNMTMFIVMKRYDMTLSEYLSLFTLTFRERIQLLAQLLEAVDHLNKHGIAHRDMKADNILLDISSEDTPQLVLSDFGCCLADPVNSLKLPYTSDEIDKGGNTALMAPEIVCTEPGPFVNLDYSKADLWSAGAIAYEILGAHNPFYTSEQGKLESYSYTDTELPPLHDGVPDVIGNAVLSMLHRDPSKRPTAREILNILYAQLWLPADWLDQATKVKVTRSDVMWWVVAMATDVMLKQKYLKLDSVELTLKMQFLKHFRFRSFRKTLEKFNIILQT